MQVGQGIGVADSVQFDDFRTPLSSASFCIHLVIRYFSKTAEDRSSADNGICISISADRTWPVPAVGSVSST